MRELVNRFKVMKSHGKICRMGCRLQTLVVFLMLALMPVRALAAVTTGACAMAHGVPPAAVGESFAHEGPLHEHGVAPHSHGDAEHDHGEHCASVPFVALAEALPLAAAAPAGRIAQKQYSAASFIPDQLDPPPLAL